MAKTQEKQPQPEAAVSAFSSIRVSIVEKDSLKAMATVKIADLFFITGIRVIEGKKGLFVSMPSKKSTNGEYQDIAFPANKASRDELQELVLKAYQETKDKAN